MVKVEAPTFKPVQTLHWPFIFVNASFAILIGIFMVLGWLQIVWTVILAWPVMVALWVWLVLFRGLPRAFAHVIAIALVGGFFAGAVTLMFAGPYYDNNDKEQERTKGTKSAWDQLFPLVLSMVYAGAFGYGGALVARRLEAPDLWAPSG